MCFLILGQSVGLQKKKITRSLGIGGPGTPGWRLIKVNTHIFGLTKCTIYCKNVLVFVPVFLYTVTMLISQIKRIISSENGLTASLIFFLGKCQKSGSVGRRLPWVPGFFSRATRSFVSSAAGRHVFGRRLFKTWPKPETAHEKPLAPRVEDAKLWKKEDGVSKERWLILYKCFTVRGNCRCWSQTFFCNSQETRQEISFK